MMQDWATPAMYGLVHWLVFVATVAATAYPIGRILRRIGFSPLWSLLAFVPILNVFGLWIVALADWPKQSNPNKSEMS
jgi:hypothetical protein